MQPITGNTWVSNNLVLGEEAPIAHNERIGELIEGVLRQPIGCPEERVIVLPPQGEAKLIDLKVMLSIEECHLYRKSESAIKTYMVEHKAYLQQKGEWSAYLRTLQGFAKEKGGVLAKYLERELDKERAIELLKGEITEETKLTFCTLLKRAFSSSETLEWSDLYLLEQIPRLGLMKEGYLNGQLPIELDKIQGAVHRLATKLKPFDIIDPSFPSLFKDLAIYLIDSSGKGHKKIAVDQVIEAFVQDNKSLGLENLELTKIPSLIGQLSHLEQLNLSRNQLESIPKEIGGLTNLKEFYLSSNQLESIPKEIGGLTNLKKFYLSYNQLESIPKEIGGLTNLKSLCLSCNQLESIPKEIGQLSHLEYLDLFRNQLESIPKEIGQLSHLEYLDLYHNQLESIPSDIGRLINLQRLGLARNQLQSIPSDIGRLINLQQLNLYHNQLESIPSDIGRLINLQQLNLSNNQLHSIPSDMGRLINLQQLNLSNNQLQSIPSDIGRLINLQILGLAGNQLQSIPNEIGRLLSLQSLTIYTNPNLTDLPMSLGNIPGLISIDIDNSLLQAIVYTILEQCRVMRDQESLRILPRRLSKWQTIGNSPAPIDISSFKEREKQTLNEWLFRLEKTNDFSSKQQCRLASVVCDLLRDVVSNPSFKELFLVQAEANNSDCEDRAAMSLSELFTSWKIVCLAHDATLKQKLQIMTRAAKTNTLRNRLNQLIADEENKKSEIQLENLQAAGEKITPEIRSKIRKESEERESVEIYLNYETRLKNKLNLLSVIETMSYRQIGTRSWIDEGTLIDYVNQTFYEELYKLPLFQEIFVKENAEEIANIEQTFMEKFEALGDGPKGADTDEKVLNFKVKQGELTEQLKKQKRELAITWYKKIIGSN